jgi:hypothetical protein
MLLNEFFGKALDLNKESAKDNNDQSMRNELFWFLIDHNKLHKDFFIPVAKKIKRLYNSNNIDKEQCIKEFGPMVKKGCMEFYHHKKMKTNPDKEFTNELKKELCEKLFDFYKDDIIKDRYQLGN